MKNAKISVLEQSYSKQDRPYSQKELQFKRDNIFRYLNVGQTRACHKQCKHFYYVKENGRKEKDIKETNSEDVGNCSVCWKINKTDNRLKDQAIFMVDEYCKIFIHNLRHKTLSYDNVDLEITFYKWLYKD